MLFCKWNQSIRSAAFFSFLFLFGAAPIVGVCADRHHDKLPRDVTINVTPWPYARIYPLLDGLFQDVAATQVKALSLDPNAPNGTNLDAVLQAFQLQGQYSATAGIQNALAARQANADSASMLQQTQLIGRQSQLIQSQLIAQNQVAVAQKSVDSLTANGASQGDINAAKLQLQLANDNLTSITAQLSDLKNQMVSLPTPAFAPPPASLQSAPPTLPSGLTGPNNVPSGFSPNFPATKQMDNQLSILWERLSRLVYTMNQTASDGAYYLIQVDTGIVPIKRKHEMLITHFQLTCGEVVDIYPRAAAVNIINEKYKDGRFGLGFLAQMFSFGSNASYNREHLRITQMLSQSSYITGYGVGMKDFGWIYGITLGEDSISPGTRDTFALVHSSCEHPQVTLASAEWTKKISTTNFGSDSGDRANRSSSSSPNAESTMADPENLRGDDRRADRLRSWGLQTTSEKSQSESRKSHVVQDISYTPLEDDLTNPTATAVMVTIGLAPNINVDPEATLSADGILVSRIRETFGRAVSSGGSGGVLEVTASQLQLNTWIPVNSHELLLNLNPRTFRGHFPTLLLQSPQGVLELSPRGADVEIQGRKCRRCSQLLPILSYPKTPVANLSVARWMFWSSDPARQGTGKVQYDNNEAKIVINAITSKNLGAVQGSTSPAPLQVIDDADANPWGSRLQVQLIKQPDDGAILQLDCRAAGPQLVCSSPRMRDSNDTTGTPCSVDDPCLYTNGTYLLDVIDVDHAGGPFHGRGVLGPCSSQLGPMCSQPLIWKMDPPVWTVAAPVPESPRNDGSEAKDDRLQGKSGWLFHVSMINVSTGERVQLNHEPDCDTAACHDLNPRLECPGDGKICDVTFVLRKESLLTYQDSMDLQVFAEKPVPPNAPIRPIKIGGLRSQIGPVLASISSDSKQLNGTNLVFDQLSVGVGGPTVKMTCSPPTDCSVAYPSGTKKGYLYFVAQPGQGEHGLVPVVVQSAQGLAKVLYTPTEPAKLSNGSAEQPKPLSSVLAQ